MRTKNVLLFVITLLTCSIGAQTYSISKISPDTLLAGDNTLVITLDKEIGDFDSMVVSVSDGSGPFGYWHEDTSPFWTDSTITASIPVPPYITSRDLDLSIFMVNSLTMDYENLSYNNPFYLRHIPYQIVNILPDTLKIGYNLVTLTLDRQIEYYDSILLDFVVPTAGYMGGNNLTFSDSTITAALYVDNAALNKEGTFRLSFNNTTDWTYEELVDDKAVFVQSAEAGQKYKIQQVDPQNLKPGVNLMTITLNKEIVDFDSISVQLEGPSWEYNYWGEEIIWSDSIITAKLTIPENVNNLEVELRVSLINKDYWNYENLTYAKPLLLAGGVYGLSPEICLVSSDEENQHTIVWEAFQEEYLDSVFVFKETQVAEEFEQIGAKSVSETPLFVDENSADASNSNRYKIAVLDTSGTLSALGPAHKTMHLTMSIGVKGAINLIWEKYEGFDYSTFHIYRGSSKDNMTKIAEIPSNLFTFTDQNPSLFKLYYQVVIEKAEACDVSLQKSTASDFGSVRSNIVEHTITSLSNSQVNELVLVYPNPASEFLCIALDKNSASVFDVSIMDITGKKVTGFDAVNNYEQLDISTIDNGIYFVHIQSNTVDQTVRIIKK